MFPSRRRAWAYGIELSAREVVKRASRVVGASPARLQSLQGRAVRAARSPAATARAALRSLRSWAWSSTVMIIYRMTRERWEQKEPSSKPDPLFRKDMLEDFLCYAGSFRWISRQHLMQSAIERIRRGSHCYTVVEDGVLIHYAWLHPGVEIEVDLSEVDYQYRIPPGGPCSTTTVPTWRRCGRSCAGHAAPRPASGGAGSRSEASGTGSTRPSAWEPTARWAASSVTNALSTQNLMNLDVPFEPLDRVTRVTRFGRRRTWQEPVSPDGGDSGG